MLCGVPTPTKDSILDLQTKLPAAAVFVRGDSSKSNLVRHCCLSRFYSDIGLTRVPLNHNTYHHSMGDRVSDSNKKYVLEEVVTIHYKNTNHLIDLRGKFPSKYLSIFFLYIDNLFHSSTRKLSSWPSGWWWQRGHKTVFLPPLKFSPKGINLYSEF